jgi:hypothetical protein
MMLTGFFVVADAAKKTANDHDGVAERNYPL